MICFLFDNNRRGYLIDITNNLDDGGLAQGREDLMACVVAKSEGEKLKVFPRFQGEMEYYTCKERV